MLKIVKRILIENKMFDENINLKDCLFSNYKINFQIGAENLYKVKKFIEVFKENEKLFGFDKETYNNPKKVVFEEDISSKCREFILEQKINKQNEEKQNVVTHMYRRKV